MGVDNISTKLLQKKYLKGRSFCQSEIRGGSNFGMACKILGAGMKGAHDGFRQ